MRVSAGPIRSRRQLALRRLGLAAAISLPRARAGSAQSRTVTGRSLTPGHGDGPGRGTGPAADVHVALRGPPGYGVRERVQRGPYGFEGRRASDTPRRPRRPRGPGGSGCRWEWPPVMGDQPLHGTGSLPGREAFEEAGQSGTEGFGRGHGVVHPPILSGPGSPPRSLGAPPPDPRGPMPTHRPCGATQEPGSKPPARPRHPPHRPSHPRPRRRPRPTVRRAPPRMHRVRQQHQKRVRGRIKHHRSPREPGVPHRPRPANSP